MKAWKQRDTHIAAVIGYANNQPASPDRDAIAAFVAAFYKTAAPDDILARPIEALYGLALSLWAFAAERAPDTPKVRVFNPGGQNGDRSGDQDGWSTSHTVIQVINDDMPFLVDSLTGNLSAAGVGVHFVLHPMIDIARDGDGHRLPTRPDAATKRESMIHLEIDRKTTPAVLAALKEEIGRTLLDVRRAVTDWQPMLAAVDAASAGLSLAPKSVAPADIEETRSFLSWLKDNHYTFLGYREYEHRPAEGTVLAGLGLLRDPERQVFQAGDNAIVLSDEVRGFLAGPASILITKTTMRSTVHRPVHFDYIGIKKYDAGGATVGEHRFIGLFTSTAYNRRAQTIPYLHHKVSRIIARSGFTPLSHDGKALVHILETLPRDELFQVDEEQLLEMALGVLYLMERPHARAFLRPDKYGRFVSALVFVPRELYESTLRMRIETILCDAYQGEISARQAQLGDDTVARWHFTIRTTPEAVAAADPDQINARIAAAARGWHDHLKDIAIARFGEERGLELFERYARAFSFAYRDTFSVDAAVTDIEKLEAITGPTDIQYNFYRLPADDATVLRLKIYHPSGVIPLSDCMPLLENLGLRVIEEFAYNVDFKVTGKPVGCILDFYLTQPAGHPVALAATKRALEETLQQISAGAAENDGFNALVLRAGLHWRQVVILRAYAKYLRQLGLAYSEDYMQTSLTDHPDLARLLITLFELRFDPNAGLDLAGRAAKAEPLLDEFSAGLEQVTSLDHDRILRAFRNVIVATMRTNAYQTVDSGGLKPALALKISSREVNEAPLPRPMAEIFVYAPRVEGVHLRAAIVSRGGIRWSDRREDFRTEVLGLVKTQQVKNAVIVPEGAKGGFYPKQAPKDGDRNALIADAVACYQMYIGALLDITDNLDGATIVPPPDVVRHDGDDPYLVVAADKGTAAFSDYANALAEDAHFWLDDAFASGGSQGYDHKEMGITARGAWISVERHCRELGIDIAADGISAIGIGDMSGDVFGNGMLRSNRIRLMAAFDHRHIFLDPAPDPARSFTERQRLYALPRSSWLDYDPALISPGGGVFDRKAKVVTVSAEVCAWLGLDTPTLAPNELIQAVLRAPVDLLWLGGVGTFVKAAAEANRDVGDRGNDGLRVNASELRCRIVGEGGNLGFTQRARIEFALNGGAINTDAIDNSAGVNCSDHEVNIKILLHAALENGSLRRDERDRLLAAMTDAIASLVLAENYLQTLSISIARAAGVRVLDDQTRLIAWLEQTAELNRALEFLPSGKELGERRLHQEALTRPEFAVILSYSKMAIKRALLAGDLVDDPYLEADLVRYFPAQLHPDFAAEMLGHRLRREIVATRLANQLVDRLGAPFALGVIEEADAELDAVVRAFVVVRDLYDLGSLWAEIDALDGVVAAEVQTQLYLDVVAFTRDFAIWLLKQPEHDKVALAALIDRFRTGITALIAAPGAILGELQSEIHQKKTAVYMAGGVPEALAVRVAGLEAHTASGAIVDVARRIGRPVETVAEAYFFLGHALGFNWLRTSAADAESDDHWDRLSLTAIDEDFLDQQRNLTQAAFAGGNSGETGHDAAERWLTANAAAVRRGAALVDDLKSSPMTLAKLSYAARHLRGLLLR